MDITTIVLTVLAGFAVIMLYSKQYFDFRKALKEYKETAPDYQVEDFSKVTKILLGIIIAGGVAIFIYGLTAKNETYICLGILSSLLFSADFLASEFRYKLYHTNTSFFSGKTKVAYTSIKGFELRKMAPKIGFVKVVGYGIEPFNVCPAAYRFIEAKLENDKLQKKKAKEARKNHAA